MSWRPVWWAAAALTAASSLVLALGRLVAFAPNLGPWPTSLTITAIGVSPVLIASTARSGVRSRWRSVLLVAGICLAAAGFVAIARDELLSLRLVSGDWRSLARGVSATAPVGLIVIGLAWAGAAAGAARRRRAWLRVAVGVIGVTALWFSASFAASSVWRVQQGAPLSVDAGGMLVAATLAVSGAVVLAVPRMVGARPGSSVRTVSDGSPAGWSDPAPPRHARLITAALLVALVIGGGVAVWSEHGTRLVLGEEFDDPALAACVATAVGVDSAAATVSAAELAGVLELDCTTPAADGSTAVISDLNGLDALTNLSTLDLTGNAVSDLGPVAGLDLWGLVITNNPVSDLTPLAGMTKLTNLGASGTDVTDLGPLAGLQSLAYLGLRATGVSDIGPLGAALNLRELDLSDNAITDVGPLSALKLLTSLQITGNTVTDITALGPLPQLWTLDAAGNQIDDLSAMPAFPLLSELWLGENPLTDVSPLIELPGLTGVDLTGMAPDLPGIAELRAAGVYVGGLA